MSTNVQLFRKWPNRRQGRVGVDFVGKLKRGFPRQVTLSLNRHSLAYALRAFSARFAFPTDRSPRVVEFVELGIHGFSSDTAFGLTLYFFAKCLRVTIFLLQSEARNFILLCSHKLEFFTSDVFGNLERVVRGLQFYRHSL